MRIPIDSKLDEMLSYSERHDEPEPYVYTCSFCGVNKAFNKCPICGKCFCTSCGGLKTTCYYCGEEYCPDCWKANHYNDACSRECYLEATEDYSALEGNNVD